MHAEREEEGERERQKAMNRNSRGSGCRLPFPHGPERDLLAEKSARGRDLLLLPGVSSGCCVLEWTDRHENGQN